MKKKKNVVEIKKKYYISTVRDVIMPLSAAVFNIFPVFLSVSLFLLQPSVRTLPQDLGEELFLHLA